MKIFYYSKTDNWEDVSSGKLKPDKVYILTHGYSLKEEELDSTKLKEELEVFKSPLGLDKKLNPEP